MLQNDEYQKIMQSQGNQMQKTTRYITTLI